MYEQKYRVLNRHRRGRPSFNVWKKLKSRSKKLVGPLVIFAVLGGAVFALDWFGVI